MTAVLAVLGALSIFGAAKAKQASFPPLLLFIVIGGAFYLLFLRPQQQKAKRQRELTTQFDVGDEVLTAGGIVGRIIDIEDDRVTLETSMGASFVVLRQYIIRRLSTDAVDGDDGSEDHDGHGEDADDDEHDEHDGEGREDQHEGDGEGEEDQHDGDAHGSKGGG
jgi:preprotein translocase subunit YajC